MLCLPLLFISCQKDELFQDYDSNQEDFSKPSLRILNYQEISKKTNLFRELENLDNPSRTTFSNENEDSDTYFNLQDYKVVTDLAKEITSEEHVTYTFNLKSKDGSLWSPKLFNLILIKPSGGEEITSKILTVYHLSEEQRIEIENKMAPSGNFFISFHFVDEDMKLNPPLKTNSDPTYGDDNDDDSGDWFGWDFLELDPIDGGGFFGGILDDVIIVVPNPDDGWTPGDGLPDWGDDEGGAPGMDPDLPTPGGGGGFTSPVKDPDPEDDPCEELIEQFDDEDLKNELGDLYANRNSSTEKGFSENTDGTFTQGTDGTESSLQLQIDKNTIGYAHLHPTTPMFSPTDLERLWLIIFKTHNNPDINPSELYGIMINSEANYMLKYNGNYEDDWGIFNGNRPKDDDMKEKYNKMFRKTFGDLEKTFISYVEEYMLNDNKKFSDFFELYEFDIDEDGEVSGLSEKYLDGNKIESDPCD